MKNLLHGSRHLSSSQIIIFGFLSVILAGCLLLMLPLSTVDKKGADFMDALFTAVSAACVTGLVVHDTSIYWSGFEQLVILFLIQIGGMGVITAAVAVALISGRRIGLMQRSMMQETIAAPNVGGIIISCLEGLPMLTCLFETASAIGTVGLSLGVTPELGMVSRGILILLMFLGRVGGLTLVFAAVSGTHTNMLRLPKEKITVG